MEANKARQIQEGNRVSFDISSICRAGRAKASLNTIQSIELQTSWIGYDCHEVGVFCTIIYRNLIHRSTVHGIPVGQKANKHDTGQNELVKRDEASPLNLLIHLRRSGSV